MFPLKFCDLECGSLASGRAVMMEGYGNLLEKMAMSTHTPNIFFCSLPRHFLSCAKEQKLKILIMFNLPVFESLRLCHYGHMGPFYPQKRFLS